MRTLNEMESEVIQILTDQWTIRDGQKVPETKDIKLGNEAVKLQATVLYADLKESTNMVRDYKNTFSAEIYKCYLRICCEIIKNNSGVITAFDGDRVMAVFIGDSKNSNAAKTALQINYCVQNVINKNIEKSYPNAKYKIQQAVGIDTCELFIARTGVRGDNDLVWVGNAANFAAKMCSIRDGKHSTFISKEVYDCLNEPSKYSQGKDMWTPYYWKDYSKTIYYSTYWWKPE